MTTEELENKIGFQIMFLLHSGLGEVECVERLKQIAIDYAEQFKYDFSKECKCETTTGETWCCNHCGLPTTMKEVEDDFEQKQDPIDDDAWLFH